MPDSELLPASKGLLSLPNELLIQISTYCDQLQSHSLLFVNRHLSAIVKYTLYRYPDISSSPWGQPALLLRTLFEKPFLRDKIRTLTINVQPPPTGQATWHLEPGFLGNVWRWYEFSSLTGKGLDTMWEAEIKSQLSATAKSRLAGTLYEQYVYAWTALLILMAPKLEHLVVKGHDCKHIYDQLNFMSDIGRPDRPEPDLNTKPAFQSLKKLSIELQTSAAGVVHPAFPRLPPNTALINFPRPNLTSLEITAPELPRGIMHGPIETLLHRFQCSVVPLISPTLTKLDLKGLFSTDGADGLRQLCRHLPALMTLKYHLHVSDTGPAPFLDAPIVFDFDAAPEQIEVAFSSIGVTSFPAQEIWDAILPLAPSLQHLQLVFDAWGSFRAWPVHLEEFRELRVFEMCGGFTLNPWLVYERSGDDENWWQNRTLPTPDILARDLMPRGLESLEKVVLMPSSVFGDADGLKAALEALGEEDGDEGMEMGRGKVEVVLDGLWGRG